MMKIKKGMLYSNDLLKSRKVTWHLFVVEVVVLFFGAGDAVGFEIGGGIGFMEDGEKND